MTCRRRQTPARAGLHGRFCGIEIDQYPDSASAIPASEGEQGGVILVSLEVDPATLKAPLPWELPYLDQNGAVRGGVMTLPSGTPIELRFSDPVERPLNNCRRWLV